MKQESFFLRDQVGKMYLAFQSDGIYCQALKKKNKKQKTKNMQSVESDICHPGKIT